MRRGFHFVQARCVCVALAAYHAVAKRREWCTACSEEAGDGAAVRRFVGSFADESTTQTPP
eukprot:6070894-Prymnesium_polylepis.1